MLCYWPDNTVPNKNDWQHAQAGKADPVNSSPWIKGTNTSRFPDWIAERLSPKGYLMCYGSQNCCFRGDGVFEVLPPAPE